MNNITKMKCRRCSGTGRVLVTEHETFSPTTKRCPECEGFGVPLRSKLEEQFEDAAIEDGTIIYSDDECRHIDFEENDYEY